MSACASVRIYIPTRGRVGTWRQATLKRFLEHSSHKPILVCPPNEYKHHLRYYNKVVVCEVPKDSPNGIAITRQWILDNSSADVVIQVDDDLRFSYRPDPLKPSLVICEELDPLVSLIEKCVERGFNHGGVCARQGNNNKKGTGGSRGHVEDGHLFVDCDRANNFHYYNRREVLASGFRIDDAPGVIEDMYFTLSLILQGRPNRVICDYVWNQTGSGMSGGCSTYRTEEVQEKSVKWLKGIYPDFVDIKYNRSIKTSKQSWQGMKLRSDVKVFWKKAWSYACGTIELKR